MLNAIIESFRIQFVSKISIINIVPRRIQIDYYDVELESILCFWAGYGIIDNQGEGRGGAVHLNMNC